MNRTTRSLVKIGTGPLEMVFLRAEEEGRPVGLGSKVEFKRKAAGERWQGGVVWKVGLPPGHVLYLELW